mgnify:FL=1
MIERIKRNAEKLTKTLKAVELLDEKELPHLYESHRLHNEALRLAGELMADALYMKDTAYNERKRKQAEIMLNEQGTIAEREAKAELAITELREREAQGNYTYTRYKALHQSIDHKLYDIKAKRSAMEKELAQ